MAREARALDEAALACLTGRVARADLRVRRGRDQGLNVSALVARAIKVATLAGEDVGDAPALVGRAALLRWAGLVLRHEDIARACIVRWARSQDPDEALQVARLGLYSAAVRFDPDRGIAFATYATWWVRAEFTRAFRPGGLPSGVRELLRNLRKLEALGIHGEATLATQLDVTVDRLREVRAADRVVISLEDSPTERDPADDEQHEIDPADASRLRRLVDGLPDRERFVVRRRFGLGCDDASLASIGTELGLSRERVRQIEAEALERLRSRLIEDNRRTA